MGTGNGFTQRFRGKARVSRENIGTGIEQEYDGAGCARDGTATDVYYLE